MYWCDSTYIFWWCRYMFLGFVCWDHFISFWVRLIGSGGLQFLWVVTSSSFEDSRILSQHSSLYILEASSLYTSEASSLSILVSLSLGYLFKNVSLNLILIHAQVSLLLVVNKDDGSLGNHQWFSSADHVYGIGLDRNKLDIRAQTTSVLRCLWSHVK